MRNTIVWIYSLVMAGLVPLLKLLARFVPKLRPQMENRDIHSADRKLLAAKRSRKKYGAMFFCSSAGEYEQAKPIIGRLEEKDYFCLIVFFSASGYNFAKARGESTSFILAPSDTVWAWGELFSAVQPEFSIVVRHELWPAFLSTAKGWGAVYLIDGSWSGKKPTLLQRLIKSWVVGFFDRVYVVSDQDAEAFVANLSIPKERVRVCGDTKYDRVKERAMEQQETIASLQAQLKRFGDRKRFVMGSAYVQDMDVCLEAFRSYPKMRDWQIVVAPHHLEEELFKKIELKAKAFDWHCCRYSQLAKQAPGEEYDVIIFDVMGQLAELYGCSDAAWVGGAMHHQVHNVLEPACHGVPLAFGPKHLNSVEAAKLIRLGIATSLSGPGEFIKWLNNTVDSAEDHKRHLQSSIDKLSGAGDCITKDITVSTYN